MIPHGKVRISDKLPGVPRYIHVVKESLGKSNDMVMEVNRDY